MCRISEEGRAGYRGNASVLHQPAREGHVVTDVCFAVGCSSLGTFSNRFAKLVESQADSHFIWFGHDWPTIAETIHAFLSVAAGSTSRQHRFAAEIGRRHFQSALAHFSDASG